MCGGAGSGAVATSSGLAGSSAVDQTDPTCEPQQYFMEVFVGFTFAMRQGPRSVKATAARSPPASDPANNNKFLRLCKARHNRKNSLFVGSLGAGERYAVLLNCKLAGVATRRFGDSSG